MEVSNDSNSDEFEISEHQNNEEPIHSSPSNSNEEYKKCLIFNREGKKETWNNSEYQTWNWNENKAHVQ
jgi:hypothetical protein